MTTREAEARQYFAALTALPTEPWTLLASSLRAKLPPPLRAKLPTPGAVPIASAKRDLDALLELPGPAGDAAVAIWIEVAVERLGRHADLHAKPPAELLATVAGVFVVTPGRTAVRRALRDARAARVPAGRRRACGRRPARERSAHRHRRGCGR